MASRSNPRVLVCGGRDFTDYEALARELLWIAPSLIIHGGARGADEMAGVWAEEHGVPCAVFEANWTYYGRAAGPIRNEWMLKHGSPDVVLACPGGTGTADMMTRAAKAGVPVSRPLVEPQP